MMYRKDVEEYILCAAVHCKDGKEYKEQPVNISTGFVVCGHRHNNCFEVLKRIIPEFESQSITMGFLTSRNDFVSRAKGFAIASKANQLKKDGQRVNCNMLISEELY